MPAVPYALLLAPGAGTGRDHRQLVAIDQAVSGLGWTVARLDFPYRLAGRRLPDRPAVLLAAVREAAAELAERAALPPDHLVLGGRSMGGRICSMAVADGLPAAGLVLVSYPLHPPGRPDKQRERTAHFPDLRVRCLFVSGSRDPFAAPEELATATQGIPGPVDHHWEAGGEHALRDQDVRVCARIVEWCLKVPLPSADEVVQTRPHPHP